MKMLNVNLKESDLSLNIKKYFIADEDFFCSNHEIAEYLKSKNVVFKTSKQVSVAMATFSKRKLVNINGTVCRGFLVKTI